MKGLKKLFVLPLAVIAVIIFPLGIISFIADELAFTNVVLIDDGVVSEFRVGSNTVEDFLLEAGVPLSRSDRLNHSPGTVLRDGMTIEIERETSFYIRINDGDLIARAIRPDATVAEVLRQVQTETQIAHVYQGQGDTGRSVVNGDVLDFVTWVTRLEVEQHPLPYQLIENHTGSVPQGRQNLRIEGEYGIEEVTTSIVYIGGEEEERDVVLTEVILEPVDAVLDIGTAWLGSLTNTNSPDFTYFRRVRMEATAYTQYYGCTGKHPDDPWFGITASGRRVQHGIVAVDRNVIPLGTRLYVDGYGFAIAADVGGAIRGYKIDLFMYTIEEARRFGRRHIYVWILDEI
ncbi:MAG: 3D domain-containing protein [Defluviitaleaceae bacterium]|nr:3D domain-containing protein [Defluviitaleaceae bacterium]